MKLQRFTLKICFGSRLHSCLENKRWTWGQLIPPSFFPQSLNKRFLLAVWATQKILPQATDLRGLPLWDCPAWDPTTFEPTFSRTLSHPL